MSKISLVETTSTVTAAKDGRWKVVLAVPGKGTNGTYSEDILRNDGPLAFPPGTRSYIGHAKPQDRDPRDQLGTYPDGASYEEGVGLVAELKPRAAYKNLLEDLGTDAELSIYADGEVDDEGNVTSIYPARTNSVDLIAFGGLAGSGLKEKLYESYVKPEDQDNPKEGKMDKEIKDAFDELKTTIASFVSANSPKADTRTQAEIDAEVASKVTAEVGAKVEDALASYDAKVEAIAAADLLPSQVESLRAEARKGVDITPLIESAKKVVEEFKTLVKADGQTVVALAESFKSKSNEDWTVR